MEIAFLKLLEKLSGPASVQFVEELGRLETRKVIVTGNPGRGQIDLTLLPHLESLKFESHFEPSTQITISNVSAIAFSNSSVDTEFRLHVDSTTTRIEFRYSSFNATDTLEIRGEGQEIQISLREVRANPSILVLKNLITNPSSIPGFQARSIDLTDVVLTNGINPKALADNAISISFDNVEVRGTLDLAGSLKNTKFIKTKAEKLTVAGNTGQGVISGITCDELSFRDRTPDTVLAFDDIEVT